MVSAGDLHFTIHAAGRLTVERPVELDGEAYRGWTQLDQRCFCPFPVTFEQAVRDFKQRARMICEPDGSLVLSGESGQRPWRIEGTLFDRDGRLWCVELWGRCPGSAVQPLLAALGWPQVQLVFQLVRAGVYLGEEEFRRYAGWQPSVPTK